MKLPELTVTVSFPISFAFLCLFEKVYPIPRPVASGKRDFLKFGAFFTHAF